MDLLRSLNIYWIYPRSFEGVYIDFTVVLRLFICRWAIIGDVCIYGHEFV